MSDYEDGWDNGYDRATRKYEKRIKELEEWKRQALETLTRWDQVFDEALPTPPVKYLGRSKSHCLAEYIKELKTSIAELDSAARAVLIHYSLDGGDFADAMKDLEAIIQEQK
jgi:hypothetical protein